MKKKGLLKSGVVISLLFAGGIGYFHSPWLDAFKSANSTFPHKIQKALDYVQKELINAKGLLETYPTQVEKIPYNESYQKEALSESMGLWMQILETLNQREAFNQQVVILKDYFLLPNGTLSWRLRHLDQEKIFREPFSATIDDLRVIRALLESWKRWKNEGDKTTALSLALAIKQNALYRGYLLEQPRLQRDQGPFLVDLSYLDLKTMSCLSELDPDWKLIHDQSLQVLLKGQRKNGFFYDKYNVDQGRYFDQEKNMINQLLCAIYLREEGQEVRPLISLLKKIWEKHGQLHSRMNLDTAKAETTYESSAVYALAYRLAKLNKDHSFAEKIRQRLIQHNSSTKEKSWQGSLGQNWPHAFDHLQILLDWALYREAFWPS